MFREGRGWLGNPGVERRKEDDVMCKIAMDIREQLVTTGLKGLDFIPRGVKTSRCT